MTPKGDPTRPRSVKAVFDPKLAASHAAGSVLIEKLMRRLNLWRELGQHLPPRGPLAAFSAQQVAWATIAGLLKGGRGLQAAESLREDPMAARIAGLDGHVASPPTVYRTLCKWAGLPERPRQGHYEPAGRRLPAMDMFGALRRTPQLRRIVPETPESAAPESLAKLDALVADNAVTCAQATPHTYERVHGYHIVFGDATDLEVDGHCFDAATVGRKGGRHLRWQTMMLGPITVAQELGAGNRDEGRAMPSLIEKAHGVIARVVGPDGRVLALLDAAYFEEAVLAALDARPGWQWIVCANQARRMLEAKAAEMPPEVWSSTGPDVARRWAESQVCVFRYRGLDWEHAAVTIVARRYRKEDELEGVWRYSFVATSLSSAELPADLVARHGFASTIWMLYGTKQARENHYKTLLCDLGLHHPPSGRLGINQAFYALATVAGNLAMVLRYRVLPKPDRGMMLWRLRDRYLRIAGYVTRTARRMTVHLAGAQIGAWRQTLWEQAFAAAGRL